jgi:hypothetical protein
MKGSAIILALIFIVVGCLIVSGYLSYVVEASHMTKTFNDSIKALYVAEAGLQRALSDLKIDENWFDGDINGFTSTGINTSAYVPVQYNSISPIDYGNGTYYVEVKKDPDNAKNLFIRSTGVVRGQERITGIIAQRKTVFDYGILTDGLIQLSNNVIIDSYNSTAGVYGGSNVYNNGNIRTNAGDGAGGSYAVTLSNNSAVKGNVMIGPNGNINNDITLANNSTVVGTKEVAAESVVFEPVTVPSGLPSRALVNLTNNATININANGSYPSISAKNNAIINVTGNVTVYVSGTFSMANNAYVNIAAGSSLNLYLNGAQFNVANNTKMNNVSKDPSKLHIYGTNNVTSVNYSNNTDFYGTLYMPKAVINQANNVHFYGSIVGKSLGMANNFKIHYDEALSGTGPSIGGMSVSDWHEE